MINNTFGHFGLALAIFIGSQDFASAYVQIKRDDIDILLSLWLQNPTEVLTQLVEAHSAALETIVDTIDLALSESEKQNAEANRKIDKIKQFIGESDFTELTK